MNWNFVTVERAHVTSFNDDDTVQYGTDYELTCNFAGAPSPTVEWLFNSKPVDVGEYKINGQMSVLTVKDFQPSDVGVYQCFVYNQHGTDIKSATLYGRGERISYKFLVLY